MVLYHLFDVMRFIGHLPLGNPFSFGWSGILFGTERNLKLFLMKPSVKSLLLISLGLQELYSCM
jgi:hypothetical protein